MLKLNSYSSDLFILFGQFHDRPTELEMMKELKIRDAVATQLHGFLEKATPINGPTVAPAVTPRQVAIATSDIPALVFWL